MKRILLFSAFIFLQTATNAQEEKSERRRYEYPPEVQDDPYMPNTVNKSAPGYRKVNSNVQRTTATQITTVQVNVNAAGLNKLGDAGNEPSIGINPANPNQMVIGWRQFDNIQSNFRQAGWAYSNNAGATWTNTIAIDPGVFRSDPVLESNSNGELFYNSLSSTSGLFLCKVFKSGNGGVSWDAGTSAYGGDKQWMVIDKTGGIGEGNIYSFWTQAWSSCQPGAFTRSTDNNVSYNSCAVIDGDPFFGTMAVSSSGAVYIGGAGQGGDFVVSRTTNAQIPGSIITWDPAVPVWLDGDITVGGTINPVGLIGQTNIAVDVSNGPGHDNVYLFATVVRKSIVDPGDAMFAMSSDSGQTWTNPVRINTDISQFNTQWMGAMSVAPNGRIDCVWLDTRDAALPTSDSSSLYYSYSVDQGNTWSPNESLSPLFDPHVGYPNQDKMGDYFHMISDNTGAHLAWCNTLNGEQDVYYSHIVPTITSGVNNIASAVNFNVIPNPSFTGNFVASGTYKVFKMEVYNVAGVKLMDQLNSTAGSTIDLSKEKAGMYYLRAVFEDGSSIVKKIIRL